LSVKYPQPGEGDYPEMVDKKGGEILIFPGQYVARSLIATNRGGL
jgi:hypothetical protein